ncbi:unnamed protein product [Bursaphelenchus xylophilus]|uniref:(pine wood nematode) hypothetical protein n=1 Tax=Bursaphelenchus xylophilus TaxID=6326 RepID=A0A1I7RUH1_BURXY|nr:unnamed protein product [Bursaphelenchus xylophilus]CAG9114123.1 unnamed protein product [Bursaphelenchus xylophilus]
MKKWIIVVFLIALQLSVLYAQEEPDDEPDEPDDTSDAPPSPSFDCSLICVNPGAEYKGGKCLCQKPNGKWKLVKPSKQIKKQEKCLKKCSKKGKRSNVPKYGQKCICS